MKKCLQLLFFVLPAFLFAQQIELFQQFNGHYDYVSFGNTLNTSENSATTQCEILTQSTATLRLFEGQEFVAALLYWAGSGPGDLDVELNGMPVTAERTFSEDYQNGSNFEFFAAYADVSDIVGVDAGGAYTVSELDLTNVIQQYCGNGLNFGGWAITVIYEDPSLPLNQISFYDGLESVSGTNQNLSIVLENLNILNDNLAKIGFLAWEGDEGIAVTESLKINGTIVSNPPLNPSNNAFNGTNSYTGSDRLYNMDLDFYDIEDAIEPGDTQVAIDISSGQDFVLINNVITTINSEIPDATIIVDNVNIPCGTNNLIVDYTIYNVNSTDKLPANTPIAFYNNDVLIGQSQTISEILIGASESNTISIPFTPTGPPPYNLKAVVDDDGTGMGVVFETNETNNEFITSIIPSVVFLGSDIITCNTDDIILDATVNDPLASYQWFLNGTLLPVETNPIFTVRATNSGLYKVEVLLANGCTILGTISIDFISTPVPGTPDDLIECDDESNDGFGIFDLTEREAQIINGGNYEVSYFELREDAINDINAISEDPIDPINIRAYPNINNPQIIYARVTNRNGTECYDITELNLIVDPQPFIDFEETYRICVNEENMVIPEDEGAISPPFIDTGLDETQYTFSWQLNGLPLNDENNANQPETDPSILAFEEGNYIVNVTNNVTGCVTTQNTTVFLSSPPFTYNAEVINNAFDPEHLIEATASGLGSYLFQLDDGLFQESGVFQNVLEGEHFITIKDKYGCGNVVVKVIVIDFPRYFTPNNDGFHDSWNIFSIRDSDPSAKIYIFDRFGKLLKQIDAQTSGWDGTYSGNPLPANDYWFLIKYKEDEVLKEYRGHFTLKR